MGTPPLQPYYRARLDGWKTHSCVECKRPYRYRMSVEAPVFGPVNEHTPALGQQIAYVKMQMQTLYVPCPQCGAFQPEMLTRRHLWCMLATMAVLLGLAILLSIFLLFWCMGEVVLFGWMNPARPELGHETACWVFAGVVPFVVAAYLFCARFNPNRNRQDNLDTARQLKLEGTLDYDEHSSAVGQERSLPKFAHAVALLLVLPGIACSFVPALARRHELWHYNAGSTTPVAGPGDRVHVRLKEEFEFGSINGLWVGESSVALHRAQELGLEQAEVASETSDESWDEKLWPQHNSWIRPWVDVLIPNDERLSRKHVMLDIELKVTFPSEIRGDEEHYETIEFQAQDNIEYGLSAPGAGQRFMFVGTATCLAIPGIFALMASGACLVAYMRYGIRSRTEVTIDPVEAAVYE